MDLSVIIVTWNNEKEITPCLRAVLACAVGLTVEMIVIDNASTDQTKDDIESTLRQAQGDNIRTIYNDKNLGFAAAVNQGISASKGEFILLLNPDTVVKPGSLKTMVEYLLGHRDVGIAGGKILNTDGSLQPSVRRFPTVLDQAVILTKMHNFFPKTVSKYFCAGLEYDKEQEVDQVRGAYFWITRQLLDKIGSLDAKNFFIWFEEVDYCRRAKDAGFKVMYVPSSAAIHGGGASFGQMLSLQKQRWLNSSMRHFFRKHGTALDVIVVTLLSPISLMLAWGVQIFKIKPKKYV